MKKNVIIKEKKYLEIVGPCSKWIDGKGWTTLIPITLLENAGFVLKNNSGKEQ